MKYYLKFELYIFFISIKYRLCIYDVTDLTTIQPLIRPLNHKSIIFSIK